MSMRLVLIAAAALLTQGAIRPAAAEPFPSRPITFVVPYPAGGNVDVSARLLQSGIGDSLGQPILIDNKPGGAGFIGGLNVAHAAPDGHTVFVASNGPVVLAPLVMTNPAYQWDQVFAPVSSISFATTVLLIRPTLKVKSIQDLLAYAKANPKEFTMAIGGAGSINHLVSELFQQETGIKWLQVQYRGNAPAINDLIGGHVDAYIGQLSDSIASIQAGSVKAIAVIGPERTPLLPGVATTGEQGYPAIVASTFNGMLAPKGTPRDVVEKLSAAVRAGLAKQPVIDGFKKIGSEAKGSTPDEFTAFLKGETAKWREVVTRGNIHITD